MRSYLPLAAVMVCCFMACQKEPDATLLTPTACKIDKIVNYDGTDPTDTVGFVYNGALASRINYSDYYTTFEYAGTYPLRRNYYETGSTTVVAYDEFSYNADSTLARVNFYLVDPSSPQPFLYFQYDFTYNGGQLALLQTKVDTSGSGPETLIESYFVYTGNNITEVMQYNLVNQGADTVSYSYDTKQNYFSKQPNLWLSDNLFADFDGIVLPIALSGNNVVSLTSTDANTLTLDYEETDKQDIAEMRLSGEIFARYYYKCQ
jgi:hypothetical protein